MTGNVLALFRLRVAFMNGVAAAAGYFLYPATPQAVPLAAAYFGVTLLAAGGSALNQVQDHDLDRLMERTRLRPVPHGDLSRTTATLIGGAVVFSGALLLMLMAGVTSVLSGVFALAWYHGVYTPLKRRTPFALILGALCGAISPLIGWQVAGGAIIDFRAMLLAGLLFLWQIPHFLLLQRRHAGDYQRAGIPVLELTLSAPVTVRLWRLWMLALATTALLFPAVGIIRYPVLWSCIIAVPLMIMAFRRSGSANFTYLNLVPAMVTVLLVTQRQLPVW